jgi:PilZ domain
MIERRALIRHKTFIKGRIYFNNRLSSLDCIVRDVSDRGARLQVPESVALPDAFELYLPGKDEHYRAQAHWRKADQIGVSWTPDSSFRQKAESGGQGERWLMERIARLEEEVAALHRRFDDLQQG